MKNIITFATVCLLSVLMNIGTSYGADKSRGLWACKDGKIFVSWRMRASDAPKTTTYKLYADGNLVSTLTNKTNVWLDASYANATFSLEVVDNTGNIIDSQSDVKCVETPYHHIPLDHPGTYTLPTGTVVTYEPNDCSAYDMDGDGEQEIIMTWFAGIGATATATAPPILDCIKLDGTRLWRINLGPNILGGCRFSFLCYDFDGDGYGEVITKTAPGSKDATGNYLSKGVAAGANHSASSINSAGVITDGGKEWLTCFSGKDGKELATIDYWPYFNIQSDWDDRVNNTDGSGYGHRGNWLKECVAFLNVNGQAKPCAVTIRGIYTYSYGAAYSWDGKNLTNLWKHTSDVAGQGIYGEGAHSLTCGDVDQDGFDEIIVGAACLDHDGKLLWRTGLGHGDATHLGEFDPSNDGMEYFMVTEESTAAYACALIDAKTGKIIRGKAQNGSDTSRGLILDCDSTYDGAEYMIWTYDKLVSCKNEDIADWHTGSTKTSSINYRIFWDGDLLEEYADRGHVDKWDNVNKTWSRNYTFGYNIYVDGVKVQWGANSNNDTKYNPCLQADLIGDWREESIFWTCPNGKYYLTVYTTTQESPYKLPWLRDDHVYDMAVAWQHCGYNQPPHLSYSPVEYYKELNKVIPAATLTKHGAGKSSQEVKQGEDIVSFNFTWENASTVIVSGLPEGITYQIDTQLKSVTISGTANDKIGSYTYTVTTVGNDQNDTKSATIKILPNGPAEIIKQGGGSSRQTVIQGESIDEFNFAWKNAETVVVEGLPNGVTYQIDNENSIVYFSGIADDECGTYNYTVSTTGGDPDSVRAGYFIITTTENTSYQEVYNVQVPTIAPNPMSDYTTVTVPSTENHISWVLINTLGKICLSGTETTNGETISFNIQKGNLTDGIYLLKINNKEKVFYSKLIIK